MCPCRFSTAVASPLVPAAAPSPVSPLSIAFSSVSLLHPFPMHGPWGPAEIKGRMLSVGRSATGQQQGAMAHKAALPPVVSHGLSEDEHFEAALQAAANALPMEAPPVMDDDLHYAAEAVWKQRRSLEGARSRNLKVI